MKWIIRYIKGTIDIGLLFKEDVTDKQECIGYVDSDYAGTSTNADPQRDMCLHCPKHRSAGALLYSLLSHCLLRRLAMIEAMKEAVWLQGLLDDLEIDQDLLKINCDSMSAIYLIKNQVYHAKTNHIDVRFHFIRKILDEGDIELQKIHTKENPADMLTKVVSGVKFTYCKELLHILPVV